MSKVDIIKTELDSNAGLYGAMTDQQVVNELNVSDKTQNKSSMTGNEILSQIETTALATLSGDNATKVMGIVGMTSVDPFGPASQVFIDAFGVGSQTILNLQAARVNTVSRAKILGITEVKLGEVQEARL